MNKKRLITYEVFQDTQETYMSLWIFKEAFTRELHMCDEFLFMNGLGLFRRSLFLFVDMYVSCVCLWIFKETHKRHTCLFLRSLCVCKYSKRHTRHTKDITFVSVNIQRDTQETLRESYIHIKRDQLKQGTKETYIYAERPTKET